MSFNTCSIKESFPFEQLPTTFRAHVENNILWKIKTLIWFQKTCALCIPGALVSKSNLFVINILKSSKTKWKVKCPIKSRKDRKTFERQNKDVDWRPFSFSFSFPKRHCKDTGTRQTKMSASVSSKCYSCHRKQSVLFNILSGLFDKRIKTEDLSKKEKKYFPSRI